MFSDKIVLDFEVEKGDPIDRCYFSTRIKLTDESKNFLCEKLGKLNNLDDYFDLNPENFYIYYNKYGGHYGINELYVRDNNGRYLATKLPLDHHGFSIELSPDEVSIANCGFYPLYAIYNPNQYDKKQEKSFEDNGELRSLASSVLDHFLNGLTIQDILLQIQNEFIEKETKLAKEKRQAEKELNQKNEKLREFIEKDEIKVFKVIKGHGMGNGRSAAVLQLDGDLDTSKYYIAEYEGNEYLHCMSHDYDILLDQSDLFFVLNSSSYLELGSGFYSMPAAGSCAKYLDVKNRLFSDDQLSKQLCKNQVRAG